MMTHLAAEGVAVLSSWGPSHPRSGFNGKLFGAAANFAASRLIDVAYLASILWMDEIHFAPRIEATLVFTLESFITPLGF